MRNESGVWNKSANPRNGMSVMDPLYWDSLLGIPAEQDHRTLVAGPDDISSKEILV